MARRILIVTAVQAEADAIARPKGSFIVVGGIGRTNAAVATTTAILENGPFSWVINAGVAGSLPNSGLQLGDAIVANKCVYVEEGLLTPTGFQDIATMGFSLGKFDGNDVPVDTWMLKQLSGIGHVGSVATVATCSGTNEQAQLVQERTGCLCEGMEGAAVVHAALLVNAPAIEIRVISNTTGDRDSQEWDLPLALKNLGETIETAITALWEDE